MNARTTSSLCARRYFALALITGAIAAAAMSSGCESSGRTDGQGSMSRKDWLRGTGTNAAPKNAPDFRGGSSTPSFSTKKSAQ